MYKAVPLRWHLFQSGSIYIFFHNPFLSPDSHFQYLQGEAQSWTNIPITAPRVLLLPSASSSHSWRTRNCEAWADWEQKLRRCGEGNAMVERQHLAAVTCQRASSRVGDQMPWECVLPLSLRLTTAVKQVSSKSFLCSEEVNAAPLLSFILLLMGWIYTRQSQVSLQRYPPHHENC